MNSQISVQSLFAYPLTKEAFEAFNKPGFLGVETPAARAYLSMNGLRQLAQALGRQITITELKFMVGADGEAVCAVSRMSFQAVWWVVIDQSLLSWVRANHKLDMSTPFFRVGCFYSEKTPQGTRALAYCGPVWQWFPGGPDYMFSRVRSSLVERYVKAGFKWGLPRRQVDFIVDRAQRFEREQAVHSGKLVTFDFATARKKRGGGQKTA